VSMAPCSPRAAPPATARFAPGSSSAPTSPSTGSDGLDARGRRAPRPPLCLSLGDVRERALCRLRSGASGVRLGLEVRRYGTRSITRVRAEQPMRRPHPGDSPPAKPRFDKTRVASLDSGHRVVTQEASKKRGRLCEQVYWAVSSSRFAF